MRLLQLSKRVYRTLDQEGYARIDYRINDAGDPFCLEANPNPEIARYEERVQSAEIAGISDEALLQKILKLGLRRCLAAAGRLKSPRQHLQMFLHAR